MYRLCYYVCVEEFPPSWGNDKNPQTDIIPLDPKDQEYIKIKNDFERTVSGITIVKIERIQNPTLYAQYSARKRRMDNDNPKGTLNERRLYHGCSAEVVQNIIFQGFNRSYAGKNGEK